MEIDINLIKKAQAGDVEAFGEIFKQTNQQIYNFLLYFSSNRQLAADLAQETFICAFKGLKSLKNSTAIISWLRRIALNLYRDEMKKPSPHIESIDQTSFFANEEANAVTAIPTWASNPEKLVTQQELQESVSNAIQSLPEIHRMVIIMHHIEGMEIDEIAKTLKLKNGTVMSRLARAREVLRRKLAFYVEDKL